MTRLADDCFAADPVPLSVETALKRIRDRLQAVTGTETVALDAALDRILAEDVVSPIDVPPHHNAAVDGYAVRAAELEPGGGEMPVAGRVAAGHPLQGAPAAGAAVRIFTGAPVPQGFDTVVMQEDCREAGGRVLLPAGTRPGANVRLRGEDVTRGAVTLAAGRRLGPGDLGLAASIGRTALTVRKRLRVAIASTGDEVTEPGEELRAGAVFDANRHTVKALLARLGCSVTDLGILEDDPGTIARALAEAAESHDVVMTSGGVSAGEEDHVRSAVAAHGRIDAWRLSVKPGRPVALGVIGGRAFIGLPGNPVAAVVAFVTLARPVLLALSGAAVTAPPRYPVTAGFSHAKKPGRREFLRVRLEPGQGTVRAPVAIKAGPDGSGILSALAAADGLIDLAEDSAGLAKGETVAYLPFNEVMR
ncbi:gephyrin-like molybdotransferase Glp [Thalassobaculum sp.]|uniref:molybdopterin molybdotransferase MoeA n=1 Tax=Thalassobaculum sp. TaxID=2022740 RepID=UPI003B5CCE83